MKTSRGFVSAAAVLLIAGGTGRALIAQERIEPVVVTTGEATVRAAPDRAFVTLSAEARARDPEDAQEQAARAMREVQERLREADLDDDAIETIAYELHPEFDYENGRQRLRGYVARHALQARVDDLAELGEVLDAAVSGGATSVGGVRFDIEDREALERRALRQAVADARARAEAAAEGAGRRLGRIVRIEEQRAGMPVPRPVMMSMRAEAADAAPPIQPGEVEIRAHVTLTVALE